MGRGGEETWGRKEVGEEVEIEDETYHILPTTVDIGNDDEELVTLVGTEWKLVTLVRTERGLVRNRSVFVFAVAKGAVFAVATLWREEWGGGGYYTVNLISSP